MGVMKCFTQILLGHEIFFKTFYGPQNIFLCSIFVILFSMLRGLGHKISKLRFEKTRHVKACVRYLLSNFYFLPNDSPSKIMKNVFYFIYFRFHLFVSLSPIALEFDPRKISKFMTSSTV